MSNFDLSKITGREPPLETEDDKDAEIARLERELAESNERNNKSICTWCGHIDERNSEAMAAHIAECTKHPLHQAANELAAKDTENETLRSILEWIFVVSEDTLAPYKAVLDTAGQTEEYHCYGCSEIFISRYPDWETPTDDSFRHGAGCRYVEAREAIEIRKGGAQSDGKN
jgi:rubrerythrin